MEIQDFSRHLKGVGRSLRRQLEHDLPLRIGNLAVRLFTRNFRREGFFGRRWREVQRRIPGTKAHKYLSKKHPASTRRPILTGSGNLGRSIQADPKPGSVTIHSDLPYAEAHNEGTRTAGRRHNVRIPQRRFIGEHPELTAEIEKLIYNEISKTLDR